MRGSIKLLQGRIECPTCQRDFTTIEMVDMQRIMVALTAEINRAENERDALARANAPAVEQARQERAAREKEAKVAQDAYYAAHQVAFAALARQWRADPGNFVLPDVPETERPLWNHCIDIWAGAVPSRADVADNIDVFQV
jgi:molybdopterin-biosynthesis enzyme MoeA-like protein